MTSTSASNRLAQAPAELPQAFTFPASFAQRRLWFLDQLTPGDVSYNVAGAVEIDGQLDTGALERSLQEIMQRHESLRTVFQSEQGETRQVIHPEMRLELELLDLRSLPELERLPKAEGLTREKSKMPFDLQRGPLFRVSLLRLGEHLHRLVVTMHHIISDGWSVGILVRELAELYSAFAQGRPSPLPELPIQYVDYTAWQQEQLSGERLEALVEYWTRQLEGAPTGLQLVTDHSQVEAPGSRGAQQKVQIEAGLARALRLFAQEHSATLYMVLLAGFQTLLFRYSGQEEILVGSPIAGRTRKETQGLIGFFVNTLVLKAKFDQGITFRQLLQQVKDTTLGAYAHQELPFEKLVEELSPERNLGRTPFFQAMLVFQNAPMPELQLGSAKLSTLELENETAKFELTLALAESGNLIKGTLEYNTDLFEAATIAAFFRHCTFLLESLVRDPDRPVSQVPLVDEEERTQLAEGWISKLPRAPLAQKTWPELIAEYAREEKKVALITTGKAISYQELEQRANAIAGQLQAGGVRPGSRVAVCVSEAGQAALAILSILKAGAVAVPIDPEQPAVRMEYILKDAEVGWVVTEEKFREQISQTKLPCITLASEQPLPAGTTQMDYPSSKLGDPALLIYQSGNSGRPEGVVIPHRGLLPRAFAANTEILSTDLVGVWPRLLVEENGILELLRCLSSGATIVQLAEEGTPRRWASTIREQKVTILYARCAEIERLAREFATTLKNVRLIVCTDNGADVARLGENLKGEILDRVYCAYGMNETCGWCALYPLAQREQITEYLGAGTKLELLDGEMNPLPEGIVGEIFIGGEDLSLGYNNLAEHTKAAFQSDEYSGGVDASIYRSGDMGWRRNDGTLQLCGRQDGRVWIEGVRVEAAEVEAALEGLDGLKDAAVLMRQNGVSALLVADGERVPEADKIQAWLQQKVPVIMVPRVIRQVERIPRLRDGNVDRLKLRSLAEQLEKAQSVAAPYAPPESEIEQKLVSILEKTLGLERVGVHDDFFRIGGHSLLATQVMAQISHELAIELPLRRLFEAPTVAQLAQVIAQLSSAEAEAEAIPQIKRIARVPVQQQTIAK